MCTFIPKDIAERLAKECPPGDVNITVEVKTCSGLSRDVQINVDKYILKALQKAARAGKL